MNNIYVIMACEKLKIDRKTRFPDFGATSIIGWYKDKEMSEKNVLNSMWDIFECCYTYAIIEEVPEGIYPVSHTRWIYKYNRKTKKYRQIPEPKFLKHYCGLVI